MKRIYKKELSRTQGILLPGKVEDYVSEENPVRAIDAYVDSLDLCELEFKYATKGAMLGSRPYNPATLLKLYIYGYLNGICSSRKLERETHRNLEVIWLLKGLKPVYKTIANFRKDNSRSLKKVNKEFVILCRELRIEGFEEGVLGKEEVSIDGSFFNGDASKKSIRLKSSIEKSLKSIEKKIETYEKELKANDKKDENLKKGNLINEGELEEKLKKLGKKQEKRQEELAKLAKSGATQISKTDKDARLLKKRGATISGYNVQIAVESKSKMIIAAEVTNAGNDFGQLSKMAIKAKESLGVDKLDVLADKGYYETNNLVKCEEEKITAYVGIPNKTQYKKKQGYYTREDFKFEKAKNVYICPDKKELKQIGKASKKGKKERISYANKGSICSGCSKNSKCITGKTPFKRMYRSVNEETLERHKVRMENLSKEKMVKRSATVEHPFGTLKHRAGWRHFLVRGFKKVTGEFNLMVLCYNFTRLLNILGIEKLRDYCAKLKENKAKKEKKSYYSVKIAIILAINNYLRRYLTF